MIAYDELAAALERWRLRNGLPATPPLFAGAAPARPTQAVAAVPPPAAAPSGAAVRAPPPPPSGRSTMIGMTAPTIAAPPPAAAPADEELEADVVEEADPYDNQGTDFAVGFDQAGTEAGSSADGWPEAKTQMSHGWGQPARTTAHDDGDDATHVGDPTRHD